MPNRPEIEQLMEHRDFLRALAQRLVADPMAQEDLVSNTLEAAALDPPPQGVIRPWLIRAMHNRAKNRHRSERRRQHHEQMAAKTESTPSSAEVVARFELAELLAKKVQQLPYAYREVVLFRYYENLPRRVIAESLGISEEAVKTRLRRALEQLRESLDRDHGSREKWLTALAPLTLPSLTTASVGITLGGTLLMSTKTLAPLILVPLLGFLAWVAWWPQEKVENPDELASPALASVAPTQRPGDGERAHEPDANPTSSAASTRVPVAIANEARFSGRCLDLAGKPISGCEIELRTYKKRVLGAPLVRPEKSSTNKRQVHRTKTGADGRFRLSFVVFPDIEAYLKLERSGYASYQGRFGDIAEGTVRDLGEIQVLPGARLVGQVVDSAGSPVAGCTVGLRPDEARGRALAQDGQALKPNLQPAARTDALGRFDLAQAICAGDWDIQIYEKKISPDSITIPSSESPIQIEIRLRKRDGSNEIQGRIVDGAGQAVPYASLRYKPRPIPDTGQYRHVCEKDGSFRIPRTSGDTGVPIRLHVEKNGFNDLDPIQTFDWGTSGHRLVMTRGEPLTVQAIDAESKAPVEDYGVRIHTIRRGSSSGWDHMLQFKGKHENGILKIPALMKGQHRIMVAPGGDYLATQRFQVEMPRHKDDILRFELHRAVRQKLCVVSAQGQPVVGAEVELLEPEQGRPIDAKTYVNRPQGGTTSPNRATMWTHGKTDATGSLVLSGPPKRELGLRIRAADHVPLFVNGVHLVKDAEARTVRLSPGAIIEGKVTPLSVLQSLGRLGRLTDREKRFPPKRRGGPGLFLRRAVPRTIMPPGFHERFPIGEDGSFRIAGIPPGSWTLSLLWDRRKGTSRTAHRMKLQQLEHLKDGESRQIKIDLSRFVMGRVRGTVLWNGKQVMTAYVIFRSRDESLKQGRTKMLSVTASPGFDGAFDDRLLPGKYDCFVRLKQQGKGIPYLYPTAMTLTVTSNSDQEVVVEVHTAQLEFRLKNYEGNPLPGLRAILIQEGSTSHLELPPTDQEGKCTQRAPAGTLRILITPKHLTTREGRAKLSKANPGGYLAAWRKSLIPLDIVRLMPGSRSDFREITVPKSAGY